MSESTATIIPSATPLIFRRDTWGLRSASSGDRVAMHDLIASIPFGGELNLSEDRRGVPKKLRDLEAQGSTDDPISYLIEDAGGQAIGCVSFVVRKGRLGTDTLRIGHISDLRLKSEYRGAKVLPEALSVCCEDVRDRLGAEVFFSGVFDYDRHAFAALTRRDDRRYQQPMAQVMHQLTLGLIPLKGRAPESPQRRIERGSTATLDEVGELLAKTHSTSTLGRTESAAEFAARVQDLCSGDLDRLILVREARGGALACCGIALSTGDMRRFAFGKMQGEARSAARLFHLKGFPARYPRLPINKGPRPLLQLCCVGQREEEPGPLRDLLLGLLQEDWSGEANWLSLTLASQSPLARALDGLPAYKTPLSLLAVTRAGTRWNNVDFRTQRCAIEHIFL